MMIRMEWQRAMHVEFDLRLCMRVWRSFACLFLLAVVAHTVIMLTPMHTSMPCDPSAPMTQQCGASHSNAVMRACAILDRAIFHTSVVSLLLIAALALRIAASPIRVMPSTATNWRLPPQRRRALFQVFLI